MSCLYNILFIILFIITISELFYKKNSFKEDLIPQRNPWPKNCPKSQRNIAVKQAQTIDNLESRVLTFISDIKEQNKQLEKLEKQNKKINKGIKRQVNDTKEEAQAAEKEVTKIKMK